MLAAGLPRMLRHNPGVRHEAYPTRRLGLPHGFPDGLPSLSLLDLSLGARGRTERASRRPTLQLKPSRSPSSRCSFVLAASLPQCLRRGRRAKWPDSASCVSPLCSSVCPVNSGHAAATRWPGKYMQHKATGRRGAPSARPLRSQTYARRIDDRIGVARRPVVVISVSETETNASMHGKSFRRCNKRSSNESIFPSPRAWADGLERESWCWRVFRPFLTHTETAKPFPRDGESSGTK